MTREVVSFQHDDVTVVSGEGDLCLFRCLAIFTKEKDPEAAVEQTSRRWIEVTERSLQGGISVGELNRFETMLGVGIALFTRQSADEHPGALRQMRMPSRGMDRVMYLMSNQECRHVDLMMFLPVSCNNCEIIFADSTSLRDHALHCRPTCGKCNCQFQYHSLLKRHQRNTRCNVVKRSKTVCNKCGSNFDVPATYTAHLKLCDDAGIYGSPFTSHQDPVDGQNRYMTKRRSKSLLSKRPERDIFQVLTEVKSSSSHQLSVADLQRLVHIPHNGPVSLDTVKAIEVVTGLRIDVFTRSWSEDHHHYFVTQLHVSSQFDTTAPKIALHTPDPTNLRKINVIESMATYSGVHACRSVLQSRQMTEKWTIKSFKCLQCYKYICNHQWC